MSNGIHACVYKEMAISIEVLKASSKSLHYRTGFTLVNRT